MRTPRPWWRTSRGAYFATVHGRRHNLGPNLKQAKEKVRQLMQQPRPRVPKDSECLVSVLDDFLVWFRQNRAARSFKLYRSYIESFCRQYPDLQMSELTGRHINQWLASHATWGPGTRRNAIAAIQLGLAWGRSLGQPIPQLAIQKPRLRCSRYQTISLPEFKAILRRVPDREFRSLLLFCWDCGCRPQEARLLAPRHVDLERCRCLIPAEEGKGRRARVIYLATARAIRIVQRGMNQERIFLNTKGNPWLANAIKARFAHLERHLGKRYTLYAFRHTWITRKLQSGVDSHIVAALAGHASTAMIDQVYSHVAADPEFMLKQARR